MSSSLFRLLSDAYPELQDQRDLYDKLAKDLYNDGLIKTEGLHVVMNASGALEMRASPLGNEFLKFISDPR